MTTGKKKKDPAANTQARPKKPAPKKTEAVEEELSKSEAIAKAKAATSKNNRRVGAQQSRLPIRHLRARRSCFKRRRGRPTKAEAS